MKIRLIISNEAYEKLEYLAKIRYPGNEKAIDLVIADAAQWKLDQWGERETSIMDLIWLRLAFFTPIPWLKAKAWGKLLEPYFKD